MVELTSVVIMVVVTLSNGGRAVGGGTGADPDMRITKLPMPIQKAMARPAAKPTTAPWGGQTGEFWLQHHSPQADLTCWHACRCYYINVFSILGQTPDGEGQNVSYNRTYRRIGPGEEHAQTEEAKQRTTNHSKDAESCLRRQGTEYGTVV